MDWILSEREIGHTLNLCIGWEITLYGDQFYSLQQRTSVMRMNGLYDELSLLDPTRYILWSGKWWMFVDGMVHKHWWMMDTNVEKNEMLIWKRLESHFHIWEWWNRCRYLRFIKIIYWYRWIRIGCRWSWHIPIRSETNVHFVLNHLLIRYEMECLCIEEYYTPNLETSKSIKIGDPTVND